MNKHLKPRLRMPHITVKVKNDMNTRVEEIAHFS